MLTLDHLITERTPGEPPLFRVLSAPGHAVRGASVVVRHSTPLAAVGAPGARRGAAVAVLPAAAGTDGRPAEGSAADDRVVEVSAGALIRRGVAAREIRRVEVCGTDLSLGCDRRRHGVLAIVPTVDERWLWKAHANARTAMRSLVAQGVVALVFAAPLPEWTRRKVVSEARRAGLPVLAPAGTGAAVGSSADGGALARELKTQLLQRLFEAAAAGTEQVLQLLALTARLDREGRGAQRLLQYLGATCGARVRLLDAEQWGEVTRRHRDYAHVLTQIQSGHVDSASLRVNGRHVLLHVVGDTLPHQVLVATRSSAWPDHLKNLVRHAAGQVGLLQGKQAHRAARHRFQEHVRTAMREGIAAAVHAAGPLIPELLSTPSGRVAVVEGAAHERHATLVEQCERAVGARALVVARPEDERQVVVVAPHGEDIGPDTAAVLAPLVRVVPGRAAGIGTPEPWGRIARGYDNALHALETARHRPDRVATHGTGTPLAALLPAGARRWARDVLAALDSLPEAHREQLLGTTRRVLAHGFREAADQLKVDRTTAWKRTNVVLDALLPGPHTVGHRALADLVLHLADLPCEDPGAPGDAERVGLHPLLRDPGVRRWAERLLAPLDEEARALLVAWIEHDLVVVETATAVSPRMHRNTVKRRLERIGSLIGCEPLRSGAGVHDVLWALVATGRLEPGIVPDPLAAAPVRP